MMCQLDQKTRLTSKNRHPLTFVNTDSKQREVLLVCDACYEKVQAWLKGEAANQK